MQNHIVCLAGPTHIYTKTGQQWSIKISPLIASISSVNQYTFRCKAPGKVFDNGPDQLSVLTGTEGWFLTRRNLHRDAVLLTFLGMASHQRFLIGLIACNSQRYAAKETAAGSV